SDLLKAAKEHILMTRADKSDLTGPVFERGEGSVVWDVTGKAFLDFNSGQMYSALGHRHPRIVQAVKDACDTLIHASSSFFNVHDVGLAKKLPHCRQRGKRDRCGADRGPAPARPCAPSGPTAASGERS